ncbi:MAG: cytochrome c biogenesis protein CcsA [Prevotellaceae bacterium]|jgi:cytochrome c biogenesis factor|nr:cytochrome c biogenesis protein CcsA [Prevotellaceae bacterium]
MARGIILLLIYALLLAAATLVEKFAGPTAARIILYYSPLLILLPVALVVNFIAVAIKLNKPRWSFLFIHGALMVILTGALVTHIWSKEGTIHLREGQSANQMISQTNRGSQTHSLPFCIELQEFNVTFYSGTSQPSSFESILIIHQEGTAVKKSISVNKFLDIKGYRLFQASYDRDEKGSVLLVNKDIPGRQITYLGYMLLIIGFILFFVSKSSRISILYSKRIIVFVIIVLFVGALLFVSQIGRFNPKVTLLAPVLKSRWLVFHVGTIVVAYLCFGICFLLGILNLITKKVKSTGIILEISLWIGLCFMTTGTFLGAVWANESWGRYWGWDPKETWALITIIIYTVVTHSSFVKKANPKRLYIYSIIAFICVIITYFGVNYFLSGMHSYR